MKQEIYPKSKETFKTELTNAFMEKFGYKNIYMVPYLEKIVITSCFNKSKYTDQHIVSGYKVAALLSGSKPVFTHAKKSIAAFKVREKEVVGVKVTLRKIKMWEFFERMVSVYLPRVRGFRFLKQSSFNSGSVTIGIDDINSFPEITSDLTLKRFGMAIIIVLKTKRKDHVKNEEMKFFFENYGLVVK